MMLNSRSQASRSADGGREQALLDVVADAQDTSLQLAPRRRQVDAAHAAVRFLLAALDEAAAFQVVEQAHQGGALDAERGGERAGARPRRAGRHRPRAPGRLGQAIGAELAVDRLAQASRDARHAKAELAARNGLGLLHSKKIAATYSSASERMIWIAAVL